MDAVLSTAGLNASSQFRFFQEAICTAVVRLGARRTTQGPYRAEIRTAEFGSMHLAEVQCDPVIIERTPEDIAVDDAHCCFLTLQIEGYGRVRQCGREVLLRPGDFTLVDSAEPYALEFEGPVHRLVIRIPRGEVERRAGRRTDFRALPFGYSANGSSLVFGLLRGLAAECLLHPPEVKAAVGAEVLDLSVAAMLGQRTGATDSIVGVPQATRAKVLRRAQDYASANLRNPELTPAQVATSVGISVRYLHQLFHGAGHSFGQWVRDQRLQRCHGEIADPAQADRSISEIAFSHGFNEIAHFSRVFARDFGYPPSALRARYRASSGARVPVLAGPDVGMPSRHC